MTNQEAIDIIKTAIAQVEWDYPMDYAAAFDVAIKALENGWISVKDRMPEESGSYLCWFGANKILSGAAVATYVDKWKAFGSLQSLDKYPNVTHWMPLPEPPMEG